jgi:hypothetical protein
MSRYDRDPFPDLARQVAPLVPYGQPSARRTRGGGRQERAHRRRPNDPGRRLDFRLPASQLGSLQDIGTFRVLALDDLVRYRYDGNQAAARRDLVSLLRDGFLEQRISFPERTRYVTLTHRGHQLLAGRRQPRGIAQQFYYGFVRSRDAIHDAALYRLYQQELRRIEEAGGRVQRIVLDFELRGSINRRLAGIASLPQPEREQERQRIAEAHGLKLVSGKIPLPDFRLEYENPEHQLVKADFELVTHHYRHQHLAAKARAGFAMYASRPDALRLRSAMADPEILGGIFSL